MLLYHGSSTNIEKTLKPHRAFDRWDYTPQVYLTDEFERALLYAINPIEVYIKNKFHKDIRCAATSAHFFDMKKPITLIEFYPNMIAETYLNRRAYIYVCEIDTGKVRNNGGNQFTIDHEIDFFQKIEMENVYSEILSLQESEKLKLLHFGDIDFYNTYFEREHLISSLSSRKAHCTSPEEESFFDMVKKYFPIE